MNPRIRSVELHHQSQFRLIDEFDHDDIFKFLRSYYYKKRSWIIYLHISLSFFALGYWIFFGIKSGYPLSTWLYISGWSVITMAVIILPIHEILQQGIYRIFGARQTRFYFSFKNIYALAFTYDFVFRPREVYFAAIIPFLILNMVIFTASAVWDSTRFYFLAVFGINIGASSKDFAILNYYWIKRKIKLYFYNSSAGKSYIFEKISEQ